MSKKMTVDKTVTSLNGKEFRKCRKALGMTLREVADAAGISVSYLCDIELGKRSAKGALVAQLLACTVSYVRAK